MNQGSRRGGEGRGSREGGGRARGAGVCGGGRGGAATRGRRTRRCGAAEGEARGGRRWYCFLDGEPLPSSSPRAGEAAGQKLAGRAGCPAGRRVRWPSLPARGLPSPSAPSSPAPSAPAPLLPAPRPAGLGAAFSAARSISRREE